MLVLALDSFLKHDFLNSLSRRAPARSRRDGLRPECNHDQGSDSNNRYSSDQLQTKLSMPEDQLLPDETRCLRGQVPIEFDVQLRRRMPDEQVRRTRVPSALQGRWRLFVDARVLHDHQVLSGQALRCLLLQFSVCEQQLSILLLRVEHVCCVTRCSAEDSVKNKREEPSCLLTAVFYY